MKMIGSSCNEFFVDKAKAKPHKDFEKKQCGRITQPAGPAPNLLISRFESGGALDVNYGSSWPITVMNDSSSTRYEDGWERVSCWMTVR